jgi:hypothetical protein
MTTAAVVSVLDEYRAIATRFALADVRDTLAGAGRTYFVHLIECDAHDLAFEDPIDGAVLVELRHFASESAAHEWIHADIALRLVPTSGRVQ